MANIRQEVENAVCNTWAYSAHNRHPPFVTTGLTESVKSEIALYLDNCIHAIMYTADE